MSDPLVDDLNAVTTYEIHPRIIRDLFFKGTPLLAYLRDHCLVPFTGGVFSKSIFRYASHIGGAFGRGATFDVSKKQTLNEQRFTPRFYEVNITQYLEDIRVINRGDARIVDLTDAEMDGAMRSLNTIIALALQNGHGQSKTEDRTLEINGLMEALNDGLSEGPDGEIYGTYGEATRNGVVGTVLNSTPRYCGDPTATTGGALGPITYNKLLEGYKDCVWDGESPDLIVSNIAANAFMMEKLQVMQRIIDVQDPIWGVMGFKFMNAMVLEDRYFMSAANQYGDASNDGLGNSASGKYGSRTGNGTFSSTTTATTKSKVPTSATVNVGEVIGIFNTKSFELRITDDDLFGFGFTGFKPQMDGLTVAGQLLAEINLEVRDSRLSKFLYGIGS